MGQVHREPRNVPMATQARHDQARARRTPRARVHTTPDGPGAHPVACALCTWTDTADTRAQVTEKRRAHFDAEHRAAVMAVNDRGDGMGHP